MTDNNPSKFFKTGTGGYLFDRSLSISNPSLIVGNIFNGIKGVTLGIPVEFFVVNTKDLFKKVGVILDRLVSGSVDPMKLAGIFTASIHTIHFLVITLTITE